MYVNVVHPVIETTGSDSLPNFTIPRFYGITAAESREGKPHIFPPRQQAKLLPNRLLLLSAKRHHQLSGPCQKVSAVSVVLANSRRTAKLSHRRNAENARGPEFYCGVYLKGAARGRRVPPGRWLFRPLQRILGCCCCCSVYSSDCCSTRGTDH